MPSPSTKAAGRRIGRPRRRPHSGSGDAVEEIIACASSLFGELGVDATTMTHIADRAGLNQSSLYYYFDSKEALLAAIVARANVVPLELIASIEAQGGSPPVRLYRFVRGDTIALCELPFDINEVHRIAARDMNRFATYWKERDILERKLTAMLREGIKSKAFRELDARLMAITIMSNDEAVQNWYRVSTRSRRAREIGTFTADLTLSGVLPARASLARVRAAAFQ